MIDKTIDYFGIREASGEIVEPQFKSKKRAIRSPRKTRALFSSELQDSESVELSPQYIEDNWGNLFQEDPSIQLKRKEDEPYKDENGKRIHYPSKNERRKRVRDYFKQDNRKDVTSTKSSYFSVDRRLTDEEWKELNDWKVSPEGQNLSFKRGDKIDSKPNKFFYSYTRKIANGEGWRYEKGFWEYTEKRSEDLKILTKAIRSNISNALRKKFVKKESPTTSILGVSFPEFKEYLESLFEPWMNWENYGEAKNEKTRKIKIRWQLDHIIPLSSAKSEEDVYRLNHYTNFQPMCAYENERIKGSKTNYVRSPELHLKFMSTDFKN